MSFNEIHKAGGIEVAESMAEQEALEKLELGGCVRIFSQVSEAIVHLVTVVFVLLQATTSARRASNTSSR